MPTNFSMPPASRKALAFSMFLVITSCRVQHTAVTVSSDMALLAALLLLFPPGSRWTRSRMAYLPLEKKTKGRAEMWSKPRKSVEGEVQTGVKKRTQEATLMQCCLFPVTDYSLWGNRGHIHRENGISSQQMYGLLVLDGCGTDSLDKLFHASEPQLFKLRSKNNGTSLTRLLRRNVWEALNTQS